MMKLTVAFLAALAVADASGVHGRRHARRQNYGGYPESSPLPAGFTNSSSVAVSPSSTALPVDTSSSASLSSVSVPTFVGTGYGSSSAADSTALPVQTSSSFPTLSGTGTLPTYVGTGTGVSSAVAETPSTTAAPTFASTGFSFPVNSTQGLDLVTSVVYSTQVFTVTSCAQTVTNCPAHSTVLVTSVVPVGTTVCPASEAGVTPTSTPVSSAKPVVETSMTPTSEITHVVTKTHTYTVGTGPAAHATTVEVTETSTETVYKTIYMTRPASEAAVPTSSAQPVDTLEGTTTISSTSTTTKYITVYPTPAASSAEGLGSVVPTGPAATGPAGGECAPPVTVTVTAQETVYVTAQAQETTTVDTTTELPYTATSAAGQDVSSALPTGTATPVIPYPMGNSTLPYPTGASTGFVTFTKPVESTAAPVESSAVPTGGFSYPKPSGTEVAVPTSTPVFSFTAEIPSSTALPVESSATSAAASTRSSGGYPVGGYRRRR